MALSHHAASERHGGAEHLKLARHQEPWFECSVKGGCVHLSQHGIAISVMLQQQQQQLVAIPNHSRHAVHCWCQADPASGDRPARTSEQDGQGAHSRASASACTRRPASRRTCRSRPTPRSCAPTWALWCCSSKSWALTTWYALSPARAWQRALDPRLCGAVMTTSFLVLSRLTGPDRPSTHRN